MSSPAGGAPRVTVVVGNPRPASRTWDLAHRVSRELFGVDAAAGLDLATFGPALLRWDDPEIAAAVETVRASDAVVVASPTYKGSYTGLLKLFLDRFARHSLAGVTVIPVMVAARPEHALAGEVFLKPVLAELGAACPTPALFVLESDVAAAGALDGWLTVARANLAR